jgi:hypothetical protein
MVNGISIVLAILADGSGLDEYRKKGQKRDEFLKKSQGQEGNYRAFRLIYGNYGLLGDF